MKQDVYRFRPSVYGCSSLADDMRKTYRSVSTLNVNDWKLRNPSKTRLALTEFGTFAAVHAERLVALVDLPVERVEHKPVRAQFRRGHTLLALVEFVALHRVLKLPVFFRTLELTVCRHTKQRHRLTPLIAKQMWFSIPKKRIFFLLFFESFFFENRVFSFADKRAFHRNNKVRYIVTFSSRAYSRPKPMSQTTKREKGRTAFDRRQKGRLPSAAKFRT